MTTSLLRTILFGTPAITQSGRIVRFGEADVRLPTAPSIRRRIIEHLDASTAPLTARHIAQHLDLPSTVILAQLHYLQEAELVQKTGHQYMLIRYLQDA